MLAILFKYMVKNETTSWRESFGMDSFQDYQVKGHMFLTHWSA